MTGRPHWYKHHPAACTCVECVRRRLDSYKSRGQRPSRRPKSKASRRGRRRSKTWLRLAVVGTGIGLVLAWNWAYQQDIEVAVKAWGEVKSAYDGVEPFIEEQLSQLDDGAVAEIEPPREPRQTEAQTPTRSASSNQEPSSAEGSASTTQLAPSERHLDEKKYMLALINAERRIAGLDPVVLGDNDAAQLHAEASLAGCFASHWGLDGLKPYMRYSLAGGYQSNGENVSGLDYCISTSDGYRFIGTMDQEIKETMEGWMSSPGHRRNILDRWHKKVNIGLAWDRYNFTAIQHFEGDYVQFDRLPSIDNGVLSFEGRAKNGVTFGGDRDLGVQIYYDPPPYTLTRGQVTRTYCYRSGLQIVSLRPPLSGNSYYPVDTFTLRPTGPARTRTMSRRTLPCPGHRRRRTGSGRLHTMQASYCRSSQSPCRGSRRQGGQPGATPSPPPCASPICWRVMGAESTPSSYGAVSMAKTWSFRSIPYSMG